MGMKILHTSDWHLGKRLMERERLPEQKRVLAEIANICEERDVELVLVAGDVFDSYLPPAEAEEVFFRFVKEIAGEKRAVAVISGNHDDGVRLSASAPLAADDGVYIFGGRSQAFPVGGNRPVRAVEAGESYVIIENSKGERVYINALPYPNEARLKEEKTEESYAEKAQRWIRAGDAAYDGKMPHILLTHLFVAGGCVAESERDISLGGARAVPISALPDFGYTALGHLHRGQKAGNYARYSGSLLQYSFDEAGTEKGAILLETGEEGITVLEEIPFKEGVRLVRLEAASVDDALTLLRMHEGKYIELTLRLSAPLSAVETKALREANEGLITVIARVDASEESPIVRRAKLSAGELFAEYYRTQFSKEPEAQLSEAFLRLVEEGS